MKTTITLTEDEKSKLYFAKKAITPETSISEFYTTLCENRKVKRETLVENADGTYSAELIEVKEEVVKERPQTAEKVEPQGEDTSTIKLQTLISENFKKLNITIPVDGRSFKLKGKNTSGKSSVIDAIFTTLQSSKNFEIGKPVQLGKELAVQEGEEKSFNSVELIVYKEFEYDGNIIPEGAIINCVRRFTEQGGTLTVKVDGKTIKSPASLLKFILGETVIADPTELWLMQPAKLKEYITKVAGIEKELEAIEFDKKREYDRKFEIEQEIVRIYKDLEDYLDLPERIEPVTTEAIELSIKERNDKAELIRKEKNTLVQLTQVTKTNELSRDNAFEVKKRYIADVEEMEEQIRVLQEKIGARKQDVIDQELEIKNQQELFDKSLEQVRNQETKILEMEKEYENIPDQSQELEDLKVQQRNIIRLEQRNKFRENLETQQAMQKANLDDVQEILERRNALFTSAKMPIPGISISDDGILYKGVPLRRDQISEAEGIELCMDILIAQKPLLRLIACKNGHAFDTETLLRVLGKAKYKDYQMIIERVADNETVEVEFLEE